MLILVKMSCGDIANRPLLSKSEKRLCGSKGYLTTTRGIASFPPMKLEGVVL